jgi:hypothetical protein
MAEAAQNIPQFKLVLVGDGGTGKVSISLGSIPTTSYTFLKHTFLQSSFIIPFFSSSPGKL